MGEGRLGRAHLDASWRAPELGLQAQHISNAGFDGSNRNYALNTIANWVVGVSWYLP